VCAIVLGTFACGDALRQDELDCEEAVSYLDGCCPGFQASSTLRCEYIDNGGCAAPTLPGISEDQSACIRSKSCATLQQTGVCARAAMVQVNAGQTSTPGSVPAPITVCP
jgi:hypothetical protein